MPPQWVPNLPGHCTNPGLLFSVNAHYSFKTMIERHEQIQSRSPILSRSVIGTQSHKYIGYISPIWGADPVVPIWTISTKNGNVVGVHDVIIHSNFGFNIFRGFRSTGGVKISVFPLILQVIVTTVLTCFCVVIWWCSVCVVHVRHCKLWTFETLGKLKL